MKVHGYVNKHDLSCGVGGADDVARRILGRVWKVTVHYCASGYKDAWQLRSRIKRRAETVRRPWDLVTEDGTLLKGIIEGDGLHGVLAALRRAHPGPQDPMVHDPPPGGSGG